MRQRIQEIIDILESSMDDADKSEAGNISAGRRVRKNCMLAVKQLKDLRSLILESQKQ